MKKCMGVSCMWLNLEKRIKKIKVKKCMGVGCGAEYVEESREREKRKSESFWYILESWSGQNGSMVKKKSIKKSQM